MGYDDEKSLSFKAQYLQNAGLGGAMLFSIDNDDYQGYCSVDKFPLLRTINFHLNRQLEIQLPRRNLFEDDIERSVEQFKQDTDNEHQILGFDSMPKIDSRKQRSLIYL